MKKLLNILLPASTRRLSKRWMMVGVILASLLIGGGLAYAANTITVGFGGGLGVTGKVIVTSPSPDTTTVTVSVDDIMVSSGSLYAEFYATVTNDSDWDLEFKSIKLTCPSEFDVEFDENGPRMADFDPILTAHSSHSIPLFFIVPGADPFLAQGEYEYSGEIDYTW